MVGRLTLVEARQPLHSTLPRLDGAARDVAGFVLTVTSTTMTNLHLGPLPEGPVHTIERAELRRELAEGHPVKLVMSLNEWAFRAKRIPGSLHFNTPQEMLAGLHKDEEIVVYCSNPSCIASLAVYRRLVEHGYTNVRRYAGGLSDWEDAGLPLEGDWTVTGQSRT